MKAIPTFLWRRIFTLNIDDALENAYGSASAYQELQVRNWKDPFEEFDDRSSVPLVHLHGYVNRASDGYIFSRQAYLTIIRQLNPWMHVLSELMATEPFIILGSSLDEVDLDYFLSLRSQSTSRSDRGPSILIEPFADAVTDKECERLGLIRFDGTAEQFMEFLNKEVRDRPRPSDLVSADERSVFIVEPSTHDLTAFYADFEKVPSSAPPESSDARFFFGHHPTWSDLAQEYDISRQANTAIIRAIEEAFGGSDKRKIIFFSDIPGGGKTTSLRRVAFDLARQGVTAFFCGAASRLEPLRTSKMLNNIAGRCVVFIDDFADQVYSIEAIIKLIVKRDILFVSSERLYRSKFISEVLSDVDFRIVRSAQMTKQEARQLIDTYLTVGLVGDSDSMRDPNKVSIELAKDPIAVACCRILNDLRPLDRIVESLLKEGTALDRSRYIMASIAEYCTKSGVRYEILSRAVSGIGLNSQFSTLHPLPLGFSVDPSKSFVVPLNGTLGTRLSEVFSERFPDEVMRLYIALGKALAPRVSPISIRKRSPESRLSGRLYDLDVAEKFLGKDVEKFYLATENEWRWNSRYWEQRALLQLYRSQSPELGFAEVATARELAVAHARQAVSLERHPLTLTTLAKILFSEANSLGSHGNGFADEAIKSINEAIQKERTRDRNSVQPYMVLFQGIKSITSLDVISTANKSIVKTYLGDPERLFSNDAQVREVVKEARLRLPR